MQFKIDVKVLDHEDLFVVIDFWEQGWDSSFGPAKIELQEEDDQGNILYHFVFLQRCEERAMLNGFIFTEGRWYNERDFNAFVILMSWGHPVAQLVNLDSPPGWKEEYFKLVDYAISLLEKGSKQEIDL
jgi:hypothetical protein